MEASLKTHRPHIKVGKDAEEECLVISTYYALTKAANLPSDTRHYCRCLRQRMSDANLRRVGSYSTGSATCCSVPAVLVITYRVKTKHRLMMCMTELHGGVCHRTSTPHKTGNKMEEKKID